MIFDFRRFTEPFLGQKQLTSAMLLVVAKAQEREERKYNQSPLCLRLFSGQEVSGEARCAIGGSPPTFKVERVFHTFLVYFRGRGNGCTDTTHILAPGARAGSGARRPGAVLGRALSSLSTTFLKDSQWRR